MGLFRHLHGLRSPCTKEPYGQYFAASNCSQATLREDRREQEQRHLAQLLILTYYCVSDETRCRRPSVRRSGCADDHSLVRV
jgi:hypothetical protein